MFQLWRGYDSWNLQLRLSYLDFRGLLGTETGYGALCKSSGPTPIDNELNSARTRGARG